MSDMFINGRRFFTRPDGRKEDEDGFVCAGGTQRPPKPWLCVSVKITDDAVMIRDTKDLDKTTLSFSHAEWQAFLDGARVGEFDLPS